MVPALILLLVLHVSSAAHAAELVRQGFSDHDGNTTHAAEHFRSEFGDRDGHRSALMADDRSQCSTSCDADGRCMPLRYLWGVQKGGTTSLWAMLAEHWACGANAKFSDTTSEPKHSEKESHYMASISGTPSRDRYTGAFLLSRCASKCFVEATPGNMIAPLAAARLRSMMSATEAVPSPCAARAYPSH